MTKSSRGINSSKLEQRITTKKLGHTILFSHEVTSTNQWAKHLARLGAEEGTITVADVQKIGRGRLGRKWFSPEGGLWFSIILRPELPAKEATKLTFVATLAVAEVLREQYELPVETKWPNDLLVNGRKICGILSEASIQGNSVDFVVVGFGLNANIRVRKDLPTDLHETATSLQDELGKQVDIEDMFSRLVERLEALYSLFLSNGFLPILRKWKKYAEFIGQKILVVDSGRKLSGLALDVDEDGRLLLKTEEGVIQRISVGDVSSRQARI